MSQEFIRQEHWNQRAKAICASKIAKGDFKTFDFSGYPKFTYFLIKDEYLKHRLGTAVPISSSGYEWEHPENHYIIVSASLTPNRVALTALHEYHELLTGSHSEATQEERRFAKKFGMEKEFFADKFVQARKMANDWSWSLTKDVHGKPLYPERFSAIIQQTGLTGEEARRAIEDIVQKQKEKRDRWRRKANSSAYKKKWGRQIK